MSNYLRALPLCAAEVIDCAIPKNIPVTVISGNHQPPERLREHVAIAEHSTQGKHIIAEKSGHWIQFDEPELIVDAVRQMVTTNQTVSATNMGEATPTTRR
jgi:pimeloyl-ACP methyl ester carboxylesterase